MKAKKVTISIFCLTAMTIYPFVTHHTMTSVTEKKFVGHTFKHVMISCGQDRDTFFIDNHAVDQDIYRDQLDLAIRQEVADNAAQEEHRIRARLHFVDMMQIEIIVKLLHQLVTASQDMLDRVLNSALSNFFVFDKNSIESYENLMQLQDVIKQVEFSIASHGDQHNFDDLTLLYAQLELLPARLERFFQDTVEHAVKKSDDTAMLKELLALISDIS